MSGEQQLEEQVLEVEPIVKGEDYLAYDQRTRVVALRVSREVLAGGGSLFTRSSVAGFDVPDLVDVASYVVDGTHPYDRQATAGEPGEPVADKGIGPVETYAWRETMS